MIEYELGESKTETWRDVTLKQQPMDIGLFETMANQKRARPDLMENARRGARRRASRLTVYFNAPDSVCMKDWEGGRKPGNVYL